MQAVKAPFRVGSAGPAGYAFFISVPKGDQLSRPSFPKVSKAGVGRWGVRANPAVASAIHCVHISKGPEAGPETQPDLETKKRDCFFVLKSK